MFDFGLGATELMVIAMVALIVVGPKELPKLLRTIGQFTKKIRAMAGEFQRHLDEAARDTGVDDIKKEVSKMTNFTVTRDLEKEARDIGKTVEDAAKAKPAAKQASDKAETDNPTATPAPAEPATKDA